MGKYITYLIPRQFYCSNASSRHSIHFSFIFRSTNPLPDLTGSHRSKYENTLEQTNSCTFCIFMIHQLGPGKYLCRAKFGLVESNTTWREMPVIWNLTIFNIIRWVRDEFPDTWISGYLDIQAFFAIHYPDTKKVEISKYPSIQVSMISKYPCIQVSRYITNWDIQLSMYPNIGYMDSINIQLSKPNYPDTWILGV